MLLPALYHWSPRERRHGILAEGLQPGQPSVISSEAMPYVCLSPSPSGAWALSVKVDGERSGWWDLYQVRLGDGDDVHVVPWFGREMREVRVHNPIPPDRLWWVGERPGDPKLGQERPGIPRDPRPVVQPVTVHMSPSREPEVRFIPVPVPMEPGMRLSY